MSNNNFAGISFGYDADKIFKERDATMCSRWKVSEVQFRDTTVNINYNSEGNFTVLKFGLINPIKLNAKLLCPLK